MEQAEERWALGSQEVTVPGFVPQSLPSSSPYESAMESYPFGP